VGDKKYTKPSRFNLVLTFEQYKYLLERKKHARKFDERVKYKDLVEKWGIKQHHMASAVFRGIKQYNDRIREEAREERYRQRIAAGGMGERDEGRSLGVRPNTATTIRSRLTEYPQSRVIRGGYSDFIRDEYFER
jgi:hypothetical protein